jgi:AraC family transcriptional activator of pobA
MRQQNSFPSSSTASISYGTPFAIRPFPSIDGLHDDDYNEPHRHDYFEFLWIDKGSGTYFLDLLKSDIAEGCVCFARPGQVHQLIETEPVEGFMITFSEAFLGDGETEFDLFYHARHFQVFDGLASSRISRELTVALKEIIEKMRKEQAGELAFKQEVLRRYLKIFLLYLARLIEQNEQPTLPVRQTALVERFITLVNQHYLQKKMVADYAGELAVTPNYLNDMVKQVTGYTAGHHIRQRIIMEIKRQAIYTQASMKEIAYSLGFFDPAHFSKYFKNITGENFTDFKRSLQHSFAVVNS